VATIEKRVLPPPTVFQEISQLKEKINLYEVDLQAAKKAGDKEEVKVLREDIKTEKNLLIELQKKENLLISKAIAIEGARCPHE
jgi:ferritin-like metal-binding protein YciE